MSKEVTGAAGYLDLMDDLELKGRILSNYINNVLSESEQSHLSEEQWTQAVYDFHLILSEIQNLLGNLGEEWSKSIQPVFQEGMQILEKAG